MRMGNLILTPCFVHRRRRVQYDVPGCRQRRGDATEEDARGHGERGPRRRRVQAVRAQGTERTRTVEDGFEDAERKGGG